MSHWQLAIIAVLSVTAVACSAAENLLPNGDFEVGDDGWQMPVCQDKRGIARITDDDTRGGGGALVLDGTNAAHEVNAVSDPIEIAPRTRYRLQAWVKQTAGYGRYKVAIDWRDRDDGHLSYGGGWTGNDWPQQYAEHGGEFVAPPAAARAVVLLGIEPGSACLMDDVVFEALAAEGPQIRTYLFCEQIDQAGYGKAIAWIRNDGDQSSRPAAASVQAPAGMTAEPEWQPVPALEPGKRIRIRWQLFGEPQDPEDLLKLRIVRGEEEVAASSAQPFITRGRMRRSDGDTIPAPDPINSDIRVGAYYFPVMLDWDRAGWGVRSVDYLTPVLGYYDEALPQVAEWHIKWAVEHGVDFFAFDWYYNAGSLYISDALEKGFLGAPSHSLMEFCVHWCNHGLGVWEEPLDFSTEALCGMMEYLCEHYFRYPNYLRVDGRPVIMIYQPDPIIARHGGPAGAREAFDAMREVARERGFNDPYLVCIGNAARAGFYRAAGYDAITAYSYGWGSAPRYQNGDCAYDDLFFEHQQAWHRSLPQATEVGLGYIPAVWSGWDDYARAQERAHRTRDNTAGKFRTMCELGSEYVDPELNMLIIEAWNEWGEGGFLEPSWERGFAFLDAIRGVFTDARGPHGDLIPSHEQVESYETAVTWREIDVDYLQRNRRRTGTGPIGEIQWDFDSESELLAFSHRWGLSDVRIEDGALHARSTGEDPALLGPRAMNVPADTYDAILIRMRADKESSGQVFWITEIGAEFTEAASVKFELVGDGRFHNYDVRVSENPEWAGTIRRLRIDPTTTPDTHIAIDYIRGE